MKTLRILLSIGMALAILLGCVSCGTESSESQKGTTTASATSQVTSTAEATTLQTVTTQKPVNTTKPAATQASPTTTKKASAPGIAEVPDGPEAYPYPEGNNDFLKQGYKLVWKDDFNGSAPNPADWGYEVGYIRNGEPQYYTDNRRENVWCEDGHLVIQGLKENYVTKDGKTANYTSGSINTHGKHSWKYGVFEMRAKLPVNPANPNLWPAFWTLGSTYNWPRDGEIDIMELWGDNQNEFKNALHWADENDKHASFLTDNQVVSGYTSYILKKGNNIGDDWHIIGMEWDPKRIRFYVDDKQLAIADITAPDMNPDFHDAHYILLNLAFTPDNIDKVPASGWPVQYLVDYVKVYQK